MSGQTPFTSGVPNQTHHTQRIGGDGEEVGMERPIQVPLTVVANNQQAPSYDYEFDPSNHLMGSQFDEDAIPPNHQRSETIGSDTFVDDVPADNAAAKIGAVALGKPTHPHHSDSDVASDSIPQDLERDRNLGRKEEMSPPELKKRGRGNRYETRRNKYQMDDEESIDDDERRRDERERDSRYWDRGRMHSESFREPDRRDRGDRYRNDHRNDDWDNRSRNSTRYHRAYGDDMDDSMSRPRSRNRYYREPDDYQYSRYRHYDDFRRQDELELQMRLRRDRLAESLMYNPVRPNYNAMDVRKHMEDLRLRNPAVYRDWYNKYLAHMRNPAQIPFPTLPGYGAMPVMDTSSSFGPVIPQEISYSHPADSEQRHSISSGRQSPYVHGGLMPSTDYEVEKLMDGQGFQPVIDTTPARNTPLKFRNSHSFAIFTPQGQLMRIKGAAGTTIEITGVKQFYQHLPEVKELELFPGPLVKGTTHKNTLIQFCQRKIQEISTHKREGDNENFILLWEVLILLLKHNGNVVGSDISELLLETAKKQDSGRENHRKISKIESTDESDAGETSQSESGEKRKDAGNVQSEKLSKEDITQQFCELLLYGHRKDALDYAMNNDLWGHALFLSSKLDERTHAHVLTRFSAVLPANHPLQTLYQMLSGRQPSAVTNCIDDSYGDWRPHLAMILSNSGFRNEVESKAIVSLGDTLGFKNRPFAAQFCYLMAQLEFSSNSKLGSLMGYTTQNKNVIEATQMTEIYEFAKSLADPNFTLGMSFIERKLNYMNTLIDYGFLLEAYSYCEEIAKKLLNSNCDNIVHAAFTNLIQVGERLKHFCEDPSLVTTQWIDKLKEKVSWFIKEQGISSEIDRLTINEPNVPELGVNDNFVGQQEVAPLNSPQFEIINSQQVDNMYNGGIVPETQNIYQTSQDWYNHNTDSIDLGRKNSIEQQSLPNMFDSSVAFSQPHTPSMLPNQNQSFYGNNNYISQPQPYDFEQPGVKYRTSSLGSESNNTNDKMDNQPVQPQFQPNNAANKGGMNSQPTKNKSPAKKDEKSNEAAKPSGWGITSLFSKLPSLKPKNQMILPDDKNPAIVWDPVKNGWINTEDDGSETSVRAGPPPKDSDLGSPGESFGHPPNAPMAPNINTAPNQMIGNSNVPMMTAPNNFPAPGPTMMNANGGVNSNNKYKLPKGSRINYVDVFNPGGQNPNQKSISNVGTIGNGVMAVPNFFIPPSNVATSDDGPVSFLTAPSENQIMPEDAMREGNYASN